MYGGQEISAIFEHALAAVPFGETKIQNLFRGLTAIVMALQFACAAWSRAESMREPIKLRKLRSFQDLQTPRSS
jgi:hypothetical protein